MGHSGQINKNIYSCRPIIKTMMSLLSRIHKSLDMESAKSPSQTSSTEFNNSTALLNFSTIKSLKRLRPVDSDSDCGEPPTKTPRVRPTCLHPLDGVTPEAPGLPSYRVKVRLRPHFIQAHYPSGTPSTLIRQSPLSKQIPLASSSPIFLSAHALLTPSFHLNGGRPLPLSPSTSDL